MCGISERHQSTCVIWLLCNYDANINVAVSMGFSFRRVEPSKDTLVERERGERSNFSGQQIMSDGLNASFTEALWEAFVEKVERRAACSPCNLAIDNCAGFASLNSVLGTPSIAL